MNNKMIFAATLAAGAVIGAVGAWFFAKNKYSAIAQEEIDSVKEHYSVEKRTYIDAGTVKKTAQILDMAKDEVFSDKEKAESIIKKQNYISTEADPRMATKRTPYVIAPTEFDTLDEYDQITLTYYADGVLADELDEKIEDVDATVGSESLTHFGEYEDDSVYVRNDARKTDYEILLDRRRYSDVVKTMPHPMEVR